MFDRLQKEAGGLFKLVDLAPEEDGAMEFIKAKRDAAISAVRLSTRYTPLFLTGVYSLAPSAGAAVFLFILSVFLRLNCETGDKC